MGQRLSLELPLLYLLLYLLALILGLYRRLTDQDGTPFIGSLLSGIVV